MDLSQNELGINCAQHFSDLLKKNTSIKNFNLSKISLTLKGCEIILEGLILNCTIHILNVGGNGETEDIVRKIQNILNQNEVRAKKDK